MIGLLQPAPSDLLVSVNTDDNDLVISWRSVHPTLQLQLRLVQVDVTSECVTGVMPPQDQAFTFEAGEGNSVTVATIGMLLNTA